MGPIPRIKTERLMLRPFCLYDVKAYYRLATDPEVLKGTDMPHDLEEAAAREWVVGHPEYWQRRKELFMLITSLETREIVGSASLFTHERHNKAELGYWIAHREWGKGYATEATSEMVKFAFETMKLHRLEANHLVRNPSSGRVIEKLGFRYEGLLRESYLKDGSYEDLKYYGFLASEYNAAHEKLDEIEEKK
jgi:RimJ/RimL family protein N-acetyltransferase